MRSRRFEPPITTGVFPVLNIQEHLDTITVDAMVGHTHSRDGCCRRHSGNACVGHDAEHGKHITYQRHGCDALNEAKVRSRDNPGNQLKCEKED